MKITELVVGEIYWLCGIGPRRYCGLWGEVNVKGASPEGAHSLSFIHVRVEHDYAGPANGYAASIDQVEARVTPETPWLAAFRVNTDARNLPEDVADIDHILHPGWQLCEQCRHPMNPVETMLGLVCGGCCQKNHRTATRS